MAPHDPLFKQLLQAFFGDFLRLLAPDVAARLDGSKATFVSQETRTGRPTGNVLIPDLVARVPARTAGSASTEETVLVHVEVERDHRSDRAMGRRMWAYTQALELRHRLPVLPIVLYLRGGPSKPVEKRVERRVTARSLGTFGYLAWGLSRASAELYVERSEPLAWAFAALMRAPESWTRVEHRLHCVLPLIEAELDEVARDLLLNCVHTYLELNDDERKEYEMARAQRHPKLEDVEMTYADRIRTEGRRQLLVELLEDKFGTLSQPAREKLERLGSDQRLGELARRLLVAQSLDELGLA